MSSTPPPVTRTLADFAVALRYEDLPSDIVASAKRCILDSLGCGLYGSATPWTHAVARTVAKLGARPAAGAWGLTLRADALGAALINGTAVQGSSSTTPMIPPCRITALVWYQRCSPWPKPSAPSTAAS